MKIRLKDNKRVVEKPRIVEDLIEVLEDFEKEKELVEDKNDRKDELVSFVKNALKRLNQATDFEIAEETGIRINSVTPRRGELYELGFIEPCGFKMNPISKRQAQRWRVAKSSG